jgi:hypothetical protein
VSQIAGWAQRAIEIIAEPGKDSLSDLTYSSVLLILIEHDGAGTSHREKRAGDAWPSGTRDGQPASEYMALQGAGTSRSG